MNLGNKMVNLNIIWLLRVQMEKSQGDALCWVLTPFQGCLRCALKGQ